MPALDAFAAEKLRALEAAHLRRHIATVEPLEGLRVRRNGLELVNFCSNDYLGLAAHPCIRKAAADAALRYGAGAGASRHVTGTHPIYAELEAALTKAKGAEAAAVFGSGYLTNIGVIPALVGAGDLILMDKLCHACLYDGAKLSGATIKRFSHNDLDNLSNLLKEKENYNNILILTETVFSMDGDLAPVAEMKALAEEYGAWLLTDDAHGFGVIQPEARAHLQVGTLSKAVGAYGGYVAASRPVTDLIKNNARSLMFTTALPPAIVAAALASVRVIAAEPERRAQALAYAKRFAAELGLPGAQSAIVPVVLGEERATLAASVKLEEGGFLVQAIRPPTVPKGTARLRFTFSAAHREEEIIELINFIKNSELI